MRGQSYCRNGEFCVWDLKGVIFRDERVSQNLLSHEIRHLELTIKSKSRSLITFMSWFLRTRSFFKLVETKSECQMWLVFKLLVFILVLRHTIENHSTLQEWGTTLLINPTDWRGYVNDNVVVHMHKWLRRITMFEVAHAPCYTRESSPNSGY